MGWPGQNLDSWEGATQLGIPTTYVYDDFPFKVLLIVVDGLSHMYREGGRVYLQKYACLFRGKEGEFFFA